MTHAHDTTPAGVYELCDTKKLLKTLNFVVNEALPDGDDTREMLLTMIDAIEAKLDEAEKVIEARAA